MKIEDIRNYVDISNWENFSECCVFEIEHNQTNYDNLTSLKRKVGKLTL